MDRIENKITQISWLGELGSKYLPPHTRIEIMKNVRYDGKSFILQWGHGFTGSGTMLIKTEADVTPPHKEIINGQEVWVGSLVVPTIDMTIPITGKSLAEILALVSGVHPLIEAVNKQ